jgi:protein-S-isoprenylcysteine O-methyltransferase Ste14
MVPRKKIIVWAVMIGVLICALALRLSGIMPANIRDFGVGNGPGSMNHLLIIVTPWLLFSLYWEIAAKNVAADKSAEPTRSRGVHVVLTNVAILLTVIQLHGSARLLPTSIVLFGIGVAIESIGLLLAIWSRRCLGRNWSGRITIKVEHQLIRSGPYRLLRHPIYTGILVMYTGTAMASGTWLAMLGLAMAVFAYARKIRLEEAIMRSAFGTEYDAYSRDTWAFVPGLY